MPSVSPYNARALDASFTAELLNAFVLASMSSSLVSLSRIHVHMERVTRDAVTIKKVFGEPLQKNGVTVIPAAKVMGGG